MTDSEIMVMKLSAKGYSCSQIMMIGCLRYLGRENPDLVRAMGGLTKGGAGGAATCGALTGALCCVGLYCGKGQDAERAAPDGVSLSYGLVKWFRQQPFAQNGTDCLQILETLYNGLPTEWESGPDFAALAHCGPIVVWVWDELTRLLLEHDIDPGQGREAE
jgi:hypothetical protein